MTIQQRSGIPEMKTILSVQILSSRNDAPRRYSFKYRRPFRQARKYQPFANSKGSKSESTSTATLAWSLLNLSDLPRTYQWHLHHPFPPRFGSRPAGRLNENNTKDTNKIQITKLSKGKIPTSHSPAARKEMVESLCQIIMIKKKGNPALEGDRDRLAFMFLLPMIWLCLPLLVLNCRYPRILLLLVVVPQVLTEATSGLC